MDVMTALFGDIEMADSLSASSAFVAESKKSPHYQKMIKGMQEIAKRNNQLTDDQINQLKRQRDNIYKRQVINRIKSIDDIATASKDTVEVAAILSKHNRALKDGTLSFATNFTAPVIDLIEESAYSNTSGLRRKPDGTLDHTAKRVYVASDNKRVAELANLSVDDKRRAVDAARIIDEDDSSDPFEEWVENQLKLQRAQEARKAIGSGNTMKEADVSTGTNSIDWSKFV